MFYYLSVQTEFAIIAGSLLFLLSYALLTGNGTSRQRSSARSHRPVLD